MCLEPNLPQLIPVSTGPNETSLMRLVMIHLLLSINTTHVTTGCTVRLIPWVNWVLATHYQDPAVWTSSYKLMPGPTWIILSQSVIMIAASLSLPGWCCQGLCDWSLSSGTFSFFFFAQPRHIVGVASALHTPPIHIHCCCSENSHKLHLWTSVATTRSNTQLHEMEYN